MKTKDLAKVDPVNKGLSRIDLENRGLSLRMPKKAKGAALRLRSGRADATGSKTRESFLNPLSVWEDDFFLTFATQDNPLNDADRFLLALSQVSNKRLTFKELTGKEGDRPAF